MSTGYGAAMGAELVEIVRDYVARQNAPLLARIEALEAMTGEIVERGIRYRGTFQPAETYARGDVTTFDGSMWAANTTTRDRPGTSKAWTLAVKQGRDGKDAK